MSLKIYYFFGTIIVTQKINLGRGKSKNWKVKCKKEDEIKEICKNLTFLISLSTDLL